jgi:hypothetical protein
MIVHKFQETVTIFSKNDKIYFIEYVAKTEEKACKTLNNIYSFNMLNKSSFDIADNFLKFMEIHRVFLIINQND